MRTPLTVFEHSTLSLADGSISEQQLRDLQTFHGSRGTDAFALVHRGIRMGSFVGVIQVGETVLEILPKADRDGPPDAQRWRARLINMLRVVHELPLQAPTESSLALQPGAVLHLYFELFVREVESLVHRGLVRQYRRERDQATALKGRLVLAEHVRRNLLHRERFYVERAVYDRDHLVHAVLAAALTLIERLGPGPALKRRFASLSLDFPPQQDIPISPALFEQLSPKLTSRKFSPYTRAVHIARLLLLSEHPDLRGGRRPVLALLFDMNMLWEGFVTRALRRSLGPKGFSVSAQASKSFWSSELGSVAIRPDIIVHAPGLRLAIDTKWKLLRPDERPSAADLRQLYVYTHYFDCTHAALLYPGTTGYMRGAFAKTQVEDAARHGALLRVDVGQESTKAWMEEIAGGVKSLLQTP